MEERFGQVEEGSEEGGGGGTLVEGMKRGVNSCKKWRGVRELGRKR